MFTCVQAALRPLLTDLLFLLLTLLHPVLLLPFLLFSGQDSEKRTPLHAAAYLGDAEIIELLILSGGLCGIWPTQLQIQSLKEILINNYKVTCAAHYIFLPQQKTLQIFAMQIPFVKLLPFCHSLYLCLICFDLLFTCSRFFLFFL